MPGIITTNSVNCRDCYKCVRACPVKAIRIQQGHAQVVAERCIGDGRCLTVCPQKAKTLLSAWQEVSSWLRAGETVVASIAPSFKGLGGDLASWGEALEKLGFARSEETALGAALVATATKEELARQKGPLLTSACPAIVNLIKSYYPELVRYLSPLVSPVIAHGRWLKQRLGAKIKVVFIGPCAAKKAEIEEEGLTDAVDAALTFAEVCAWFAREGLLYQECKLKTSHAANPIWARARYFPVSGGELWTTGLASAQPVNKYVTITGLERCQEFLANFHKIGSPPQVVELLACAEGCIGGPVFGEQAEQLWQRRARLLQQAGAGLGPLAFAHGQIKPVEAQLDELTAQLPLRRSYASATIASAPPADAELKAILARMGKENPEDELNCGACGYNSCREKAKAIWAGMAEEEMCIPNMRARAEALARLVSNETMLQAQKVIDKQMRVAQEIAGLLGETTAETKTVLTKLVQMIQNQGGQNSSERALFGNRDSTTGQEK